MFRTLACVVLLLCSNAVHAATAKVAAAATLRHALEEIAPEFKKATGHDLKVAFGSSGNFYSQIMQGAPFDVFLSADTEFPQKLVDAKKAQPPVRVYAEGRLVLLLPLQSRLKVDGRLKDLAAAMEDGRLTRLAIANPNVAPYGMRAKEALSHAGLWGQAQPRLVIGENVGQATQFATTGAAQAGLVALSLALAPQLAANDGILRAVEIICPQGNVLNPFPPAAVSVRHNTCQRFADTAIRALVDLWPNLQVAGSSVTFFGVNINCERITVFFKTSTIICCLISKKI